MKDIVKYVRYNLNTFLWFEITFRILLIFLFVTGGGRIVDTLLRFQGYSYVTQNNYRSFLANPVSILGLGLMGLLILFLILFEVTSLLLIYEAGRKEERIQLGDLLVNAYTTVKGFIKRYPWTWGFYMLLCLPNLYLQMILWEADRAKFIVIVVQDICDVITIPGFVCIMAVYLMGSMLLSLALPFRLFGNEEAFSRPMIIMDVAKGKHWNHLGSSLSVHTNVLLGAGSVYVAVVLICIYFVWTFRPVARFVSDALVYGSILKLVLGIVIGFLGTILIVGYIYLVYDAAEQSEIPPLCKTSEKKKRLAVWASVSVSGSILFLTGLQYIPNTAEAQGYIEITAHRGGAKYAPENTIASLYYSIDTKSDYAEIDVQETADGEIVLLHDNWLGRTTGRKDYIWNLTLEEVQALDAGSFFSNAYAGETIPTLTEVIRECKGKIRLNIEIKSNGHNGDIVEKVLQIIQDENFISNCVVTSMDYKLLKQIKELCPEVVTGYTLSMVYGRVEALDAVDFYSVKHTYVTRSLVDRIHSMGKKICAWTVNSRGDMRKVINCNVDNVITDNPELVRKEILQEEDTRPDFLSLVKYALM